MMDSLKWLTVYEMILGVIHLFLLVWYAIPVTRRSARWIDFVPSAGVIIMLASLWSGDTSLLALVFYFLTIILFLSTVKRVFKVNPLIAAPKRIGFKAVKVVLSLFGVLVLAFAVQYGGEMRYNPSSDFSGLGYSDAFVQLNERLSVEYPFGDWKKIDWDRLKDQYEPIFAEAEKTRDKDLYNKTLRDYLATMRDGHIRIVNDKVYDSPVYKKEGGGGFGISTIRLDNGRVLVTLVLKDSPADKVGIKVGTEIISWDGVDAGMAYRLTRWSDSPNTNQNENVNQGRFMVRASIGQEVTVVYKHEADGEVMTARLKAYDDQYETLRRTKPQLTRETPLIEGSILDNGYGYIKITSFLPDKAASDPSGILKHLLNDMIAKQVKGLIIDLRDNPGGEDALVVKMAGHFVSQATRYSYVSYYNRHTGKFEINKGEDYKAIPSKPQYHGKIAILVNGRTASSGEGLPLLLKGQPNVTIVGFTGTNGSFGVASSPIMVKMPEGYMVESADGRALDVDGVIQGDGDDTGAGGAIPDIRIPLDEETFAKKYVEGSDVEILYAIEAMEP
ncbi:S41 family peptidase [Paenibacillus paeoniae]|nr:S41 family peptidase [Paenibacillus paeoniae]